MNTRRLIQEHIKSLEKTGCFSMSQLEILRYVGEKKDPLMKEVADYLNITPPSATALIDNLVDAKLLRRIHDQKNRRIVRLAITPKGRLSLKKEFAKMKAGMKEILSQLGKQEINILIQIHEKLAKVLRKK